MEIIEGTGVTFQYNNRSIIIDNLDITIETGRFSVLLGKNGCGKSTLVKLIDGLLPLSNGKILVNGIDISKEEGLNEVRRKCGIIFQNPDNQFISPIVEDDIRFGLDNHRIPEEEYETRIKFSLEKVNLSGYENRNISTLSGGQKQRAAAAGILALDPDILIFDEATSMLDPQGREDMIYLIKKLRLEKKTIIMITQNIRDALDADKIFLMADGKITAKGTPREILTNMDLLERAGVQIPIAVRLWNDLLERGIRLQNCPLTIEELSGGICSLI